MNKEEFIAELKDGLSGLPQNDIDERVLFYTEMIDDRMEEGMSEEEAISGIGSVEEIVSQIISEVPLTKIVKKRITPDRALRTWEIVLIVLGSPLWLSLLLAALCVILAMYAVVWSVILSLWAAELSLIACALSGIAGAVVSWCHGDLLPGFAMLGAGFLSGGLSVFGFFGCLAASKGILILTKKAMLWIKSRFIRKDVLTSLGLAILMGVLLISDFDVSKLDKTEYETNTHRVSEDFDKIIINTQETDIVLLASDDNVSKVICMEQKKLKHSVSVENGTLQISEMDTRKWYDHITLFAKPVSLKIYLPSDQLESLRIDSGTGDVSVPAALTFGSVGMKASTGDIVFESSVDGELKMITDTGDITLSGVKAGKIDLSVSTGEILMQSVICRETASVRVETGDTRITDMTCRNLLTTGSTGDITLKNTVASDTFSIARSTGDVILDHCVPFRPRQEMCPARF